jgi:hypothetical protein
VDPDDGDAIRPADGETGVLRVQGQRRWRPPIPEDATHLLATLKVVPALDHHARIQANKLRVPVETCGMPVADATLSELIGRER